MTKGRITNIAASIKQGLQTKARETRRPFQDVLLYFAMERFLYRLSISQHASKFTLKGGLLLPVWRAPGMRPTRDIDLLGCMENSVAAVTQVVREICRQAVEPDDGLKFDPQTVTGEIIREEAEYSGVRVKFRCTLEKSQIPMRIDVGFGDVIVPAAAWADLPTQLDHPAPQLRCYQRETMIAEKFEAMVKRGLLNGRTKDFYDIWLLAQQFSFDGATLSQAIVATFGNRGTTLLAEPPALTSAFADIPQRSKDWLRLLDESRIEDLRPSLDEAINVLASFLLPIIQSLAQGQPFDMIWQAPGGWQPRGS